MPEPADAARERKRAAYEAARRREAVVMLQIAEATCRYGAAQLANGTAPAEAGATVVFVAGELADVAAALRRLERMTTAQRRVRAAQLTALGMSREEVGRRLGVTAKTIRNYLKAAAPEMAGPPPRR